MRKLLFITAIAVMRLTTMNAQEVKLGAKAGLNFATFTDNTTDEFDITSDITAGLVIELPISEKFSFQPEILYSGQGTSSAILTYLNVPLMGKYEVLKGISLEAGPQIGFLLSAKDNDTDVSIKDEFTNVAVGVGFGLGYQFNNGLFFNTRYHLGVSNISNIEGVSSKNRFLQVSIGYFFF